jgi:hypothetical protein
MSLDHQQSDSPFKDKSRLMRNSGLESGPCSSMSKDREFTHSSSNHKPNLFIDEPPPYEVGNNPKTQVDTPLLNAMSHSAQAQGQRTFPAAKNDTVPGQLLPRPVGIEESHLRRIYNFNPTILSINLPPYLSVNFTVVHLFLIVIFVFGIYWLAWSFWKLGLGFSGPFETPTKG